MGTNETSSPYILVVDDDEFFRKVVIQILRQGQNFSHANFVEAENGLIAWELAQNNRPAAVILDLIMPEMTGQELASKLRELYPGLPILVLTSNTNPEVRRRLEQKFNVSSYLIKGGEKAALLVN